MATIKITRKWFEQYLNDVMPDWVHICQNTSKKQRYSRSPYGSGMRRHDPAKFNAEFHSYCKSLSVKIKGKGAV